MGYFQDIANTPEAAAARAAKYAKTRAELVTRHFETVGELVRAYAKEHEINIAQAMMLTRKRWGRDGNSIVILSNTKSAYSSPWGKVKIDD